MRLGRFEQAIAVCADPACPWRALPDREHFERHNAPCGELFISRDGGELLCELLAGHDGAHRGSVHSR